MGSKEEYPGMRSSEKIRCVNPFGLRQNANGLRRDNASLYHYRDSELGSNSKYYHREWQEANGLHPQNTPLIGDFEERGSRASQNSIQMGYPSRNYNYKFSPIKPTPAMTSQPASDFPFHEPPFMRGGQETPCMEGEPHLMEFMMHQHQMMQQFHHYYLMGNYHHFQN